MQTRASKSSATSWLYHRLWVQSEDENWNYDSRDQRVLPTLLWVKSRVRTELCRSRTSSGNVCSREKHFVSLYLSKKYRINWTNKQADEKYVLTIKVFIYLPLHISRNRHGHSWTKHPHAFDACICVSRVRKFTHKSQGNRDGGRGHSQGQFITKR